MDRLLMCKRRRVECYDLETQRKKKNAVDNIKPYATSNSSEFDDALMSIWIKKETKTKSLDMFHHFHYNKHVAEIDDKSTSTTIYKDMKIIQDSPYLQLDAPDVVDNIYYKLLAFNEPMNIMAVALAEEVYFYNVKTKKRRLFFGGHDGDEVSIIEFSKDGSQIVICTFTDMYWFALERRRDVQTNKMNCFIKSFSEVKLSSINGGSIVTSVTFMLSNRIFNSTNGLGSISKSDDDGLVMYDMDSDDDKNEDSSEIEMYEDISDSDTNVTKDDNDTNLINNDNDLPVDINKWRHTKKYYKLIFGTLEGVVYSWEVKKKSTHEKSMKHNVFHILHTIKDNFMVTALAINPKKEHLLAIGTENHLFFILDCTTLSYYKPATATTTTSTTSTTTIHCGSAAVTDIRWHPHHTNIVTCSSGDADRHLRIFSIYDFTKPLIQVATGTQITKIRWLSESLNMDELQCLPSFPCPSSLCNTIMGDKKILDFLIVAQGYPQGGLSIWELSCSSNQHLKLTRVQDVATSISRTLGLQINDAYIMLLSADERIHILSLDKSCAFFVESWMRKKKKYIGDRMVPTYKL
jgi:hypothetical protein